MTARPGNRGVVLRLVAIVVTMGAASFGAVPFYDWFCRTTGYGGTTSVAAAGSDVILDRTIRIRFDASVASDMPWNFRPVEREITLRIGETGLAFYEAYNPSSVPVAGTASYNVVPYSAGAYFDKIACFCFTEQVLAPGETVQMPVTFYVDPAILEDPEGKYVREITLSYTFHRNEMPEAASLLRPDPTKDSTGLN